MIYADNSLIDNTIPATPHTLNEFPIFLAPSGGNPGCPGGSISANGGTVVFDITCININTGNTGLKAGDLIMFQNANGVSAAVHHRRSRARWWRLLPATLTS